MEMPHGASQGSHDRAGLAREAFVNTTQSKGGTELSFMISMISWTMLIPTRRTTPIKDDMHDERIDEQSPEQAMRTSPTAGMVRTDLL